MPRHCLPLLRFGHVDNVSICICGFDHRWICPSPPLSSHGRGGIRRSVKELSLALHTQMPPDNWIESTMSLVRWAGWLAGWCRRLFGSRASKNCLCNTNSMILIDSRAVVFRQIPWWMELRRERGKVPVCVCMFGHTQLAFALQTNCTALHILQLPALFFCFLSFSM